MESDTEGGIVGYDDDVVEDRDVLDRELHALASNLTVVPTLESIIIIIH